MNGFQKEQDMEVLLNDCLHRLSGYDYVFVADIDEILIPLPPFQNLHQVFQVLGYYLYKGRTESGNSILAFWCNFLVMSFDYIAL